MPFYAFILLGSLSHIISISFLSSSSFSTIFQPAFAPTYSKEQEKHILEQQVKMLESQLEALRKRLEGLSEVIEG